MILPVLHTPRLHLQQLTLDQVGGLHEIWGDPAVIWWGHHATLDETEEFTRRVLDPDRDVPPGTGWWLVFERAGGGVVGDVVLQPVPRPTGEIEIGWHLAHQRWGRGYATEAARRLLVHAFSTLGLQTIVADIALGNTRSIGVAARLGMTRRPDLVERAQMPHGVWEVHAPGH